VNQPVPSRPARLALVGDRSPAVQAHARIPAVLEALDAGGAPLDPYWIATPDVDGAELARFDGIWLLPGSPYASAAGALTAVRVARTTAIPFLGTCGGFQHLVLEFARAVCGLDAAHGEDDPDAVDPLIRPLRCALVGQEQLVHPVAGTRAASVLGVAPRTERFFCSFGLDPAAESTLTAHGLVVSGRDETGEVRLVELPGHPFFVGALFQPELSSTRTWVHPLITAFVDAVRTRPAAGTMGTDAGLSRSAGGRQR